MDRRVLENLRFEIDDDTLIERLRLKKGSSSMGEVHRLAADARTIARPKALYAQRFIEESDDDSVLVEGVRLTSRVLRVNLEHAHRVFPYVTTCGVELAAWARSQEDLLYRFWAEEISEMVVLEARRAARKDLMERYQPGKVSSMAPGSLADWPLEEQQSLFALLGDTEGAIGVRLTDHMLMIPTKSVSGIWYPAEVSFESCQLCRRERCPGRRAPHDAGLYDRRYRGRAR